MADRAMCFFENECFLSLLKQYKDVTFPMLVPVVNELAENHWHSVLQESLVALKSILSEIDPIAYEKSLAKIKDKKKQPSVESRDLKWDKFYKMAIKKNPKMILLKKDYIFDLNY